MAGILQHVSQQISTIFQRFACSQLLLKKNLFLPLTLRKIRKLVTMGPHHGTLQFAQSFASQCASVKLTRLYLEMRDLVVNDSSAAIHPDSIVRSTIESTEPLGPVTNAFVIDDTAFFKCSQAVVAVSLSNEMFRVKISRTMPTSEEVVPLAFPMPIKLLVLEDIGDEYRLSSAGLTLFIQKSNFGIRAETADRIPICEDMPEGISVSQSPMGITCRKRYRGEAIYGLGEKTGYLNKANTENSMWNSDVYAPHVPEIRELYVSIPVFYVVGQDMPYGIFVNNAGKTTFSFNDLSSVSFGTTTGDMDYYCFFGKTLKDLVGQFTTLTGRVPQPPRYALGYHQSRYSYESEDQLEEVASEFRRRRIPCDALYLDIHYMDSYRVFTWNPQHYATSGDTIHHLADEGFHIIPIVDPGVKKDETYDVYRSGLLRNAFCAYPDGSLYVGQVWPGESVFPDFTEPQVREWWGDLHQGYVDSGVVGIWNDMNEPAVFNETKTMDLAVIHGNNGRPMTHEALHNAYGHYMNQATYEGMKKLLNGKRPFVLTRSGYAGTQKYAAVWTGDNRSFWEHLALAIPMLLNMGLSGLSFAGADVGGFAFDTDGLLLTRWTQMAAYTPFFRNHSGIDAVRQEPWQFGPVFESAIRKAIERRYMLLPHLYSLFYEHRMTGLPPMRPLVLEFPEDPHTRDLCDSFLLGKGMLVAPIYRPDTNVRGVYLPPGAWYQENTDRRFEGNQYILATATIDQIPVFVQAGSIIAIQGVVQHTRETSDTLIFHIYTGSAGHYRYYEDDGETFDYQDGAYTDVEFNLSVSTDGFELVVKIINNGFEAKSLRSIFLAIHGVNKRASVSESNAPYTLNQQFHDNILLVEVPNLLVKDTQYHINSQ